MSAINTSTNAGPLSCKVADYATRMPTDAKYLSLRIANVEVPIKNANDILVWVCKKMTLHRTKQLQTYIKARKTSWIKTNGNGMGKPCQIAYNCFVDLDASGGTALLRASLILQWLSWPPDDAIITFERVSPVIVKSIQSTSASKAHSTQNSISIPELPTNIGNSKGMDSTEIGNKTIAEVKRFSYKFDNIESITDTSPLALFFKGKEFDLSGNWINLPEKICWTLETLWPCKLHDIVGSGKVSNMALNPTSFRKGRFVKGVGIWYETDCSPRELVKQTRSLCKLFGVALENISITYTKHKQASIEQAGERVSTLGTSDVDLNSQKIGAFVKTELYAALAEDRIPDNDFTKLLTVNGTKELLGTTLSACPLFSYSPMIGPDGRGNNSWGDPATRRGRRVFVNSQWYERHWNKARRLLSRWNDKPTPHNALNADDISHLESQIRELLETEFVNGVRPSSIIDRNKFCRLYRQYFDEDLPEDFNFDKELPKAGVVHDGKVFPHPSSRDGGWRSLIGRLVDSGNSIFQFSHVMELHAAELVKIGITSAGMLRETMMREAQDAYEVSGELSGPRGPEPLDKRFASLVVPQDDSIIDTIAASRRLPYVDVSYVRTFCREQDGLVRISQDLYAIASRIEFDEAEIARGKAYCASSVKGDGFFSLSQLRLDDSAAMNDRRLADGALRRIFFLRFLSSAFDAHGQIVCAKGASMDGQIPLHAFLREHSDVTLDHIEAVAKEYNIAPWIALKTAHEEMIRVGRERFVAPDMVAFDIDAIEAVVADVCEGCPKPFGAFANLSDFPAVPGFSWNEYLLEAFLRRVSARFRLLSPSVPARDVSGAVVPHGSEYDSAENAFAAIALRCGVAADVEEVGDFLVATQCVLRRSAKTVGAVVARMKESEKH